MTIYEVERADLDNFIEGTMRKVLGLAKDSAAVAEVLAFILDWMLEEIQEAGKETDEARRQARRLACIQDRLRAAGLDNA